MTFKEVRYLVKGGESQNVEFKRKASHPEKIIKEMVAFANSDGGYLFIGVDDDRSIPGLKFPEDELYVMEAAIHQYIKPVINYEHEIISISEGRSIVLFQIPRSTKKPHFVIEKGELNENAGKRAFVRSGDKSVQASREMREIIRRRQQKRNIKFNFGEKEKLLFNYLETNETITLPQFAELAGISKYVASRTLVILVLANVLEIRPTEKGDVFYNPPLEGS